MFGLLRRIRDKSDSDIGEVEKQLNADLEQIAHFESRAAERVDRGQAGRRVINRIERDRTLTTDSDGDSSRYSTQQPSSVASSYPNLTPSHSSHLLSSSDHQPRPLPPHYIPYDIQRTRSKQHRIYSDEELEHLHKHRDQMVDSSHLDPTFPFSILQADVSLRKGASPISQGQIKTTHIQKLGGATNKHDIRAVLHNYETSPNLPESNHARNMVKEHNLNKDSTHDQSVNKQLHRSKLITFKLRMKTDKGLFYQFSKKIISNRKKVLELNKKKEQIQNAQRMALFSSEKEQLVTFLDNAIQNKGNNDAGSPDDALSDNSLLHGLQGSKNMNPDCNGTTSTVHSVHSIPEGDNEHDDEANNFSTNFHNDNDMDDDEYDQDIYNVVTRIEMDSYIDQTSLLHQKQCNYCQYRPLHLYSISSTTDAPMIYSPHEDGLLHFNTITKKFQKEILKRGEFINNIELVFFAVKFGFSLLPHTYNNDQNCKQTQETEQTAIFKDVKNVQDFIVSKYASLNIQADQVCLQLSNDWFLIEPRLKSNSQSHSQDSQGSPSSILQTNSKVSTNDGVTVYCKDLYAIQMISNLAVFHSCYIAVRENRITTGLRHPFKIDIWFNTGSCLCHYDGEIERINALGSVDMNVNENNTPTPATSSVAPDTNSNTIDYDSIDESTHGDYIIGLLEDGLGCTVEQYTYCLPHIKSIHDIQAQLEHSD